MSKIKRFCWQMVISIIFVILTLGVAAFLFPRQMLTVDSGNTKADFLVVLGGGDGRAERAAELYKEGVAPKVLVTGYGDCELNIQILEQNGVPSSVILREPDSLTTYENAKFSIPILRKTGAKHIVLVTSWFHSRRAVACFEHFAPEMKIDSRPSYLYYQPRRLNRESYDDHVNIEYVKLLGYWIAHGISPL